MKSIMSQTSMAGNFLNAIAFDENRAIGVSNLAQLKQYGLLRPSMVANATEAQMRHDEFMRRAWNMRGLVQREFDSARVKRAEEYSEYIEGVADGEIIGGTPAITLYCAEEVKQIDGGLIMPFNNPIIAIDGETQTEARFLLAERRPETWASLLVPFVMLFDLPHAVAGQYLHDANVFANPIPESKVSWLNTNGGLTSCVRAAVHSLGKTEDEFKKKGKPNKAHITSWDKMLATASGFGFPEKVSSRGGLEKVMDRYNRPSALSNADEITAFVAHMIGLAVANREIACADVRMWAEVGARSAREKRFLSQMEVVAMIAAEKSRKASEKAARLTIPTSKLGSFLIPNIAAE